MFGWANRPTKAAVKHFIGGDEPKAVYKVGQYEVTVPGSELEITYSVPYHRQTDPRSVFPGMEVTDGEIRIPVVDVVDEILSRISPVELALALWQDNDVKAEFISCLTENYNNGNILDADRRSLIDGVKAAIHSAALDRLAGTMSKLEWEVNQRSHFYQEIQRINETLKHYEVMVDRYVTDDNGNRVLKKVHLEFTAIDRPAKTETGFEKGELEIGGKAWNEAREFWRNEVMKRFPASEKIDA